MKNRITIGLGTVLLIMGICVMRSEGQAPEEPSKSRSSLVRDNLAQWDFQINASRNSRGNVRQRLAKLKSQLKNAKSDAAREKSKTAIHDLLVQYFEDDMKARRNELEAIRKRVTELDALLTRRAGAKDEIIRRQLEVTVKEAEGLGFFRDSAESPWRIRRDFNPLGVLNNPNTTPAGNNRGVAR